MILIGCEVGRQVYGECVMQVYFFYDYLVVVDCFFWYFLLVFGVLMEIEIWFNLLVVVKVCKVLVILVNVCFFVCLVCGYGKFDVFVWLVFVVLSGVVVQMVGDVEWIVVLGVGWFVVCGNLKFDVMFVVDNFVFGQCWCVVIG